MKWLSILFLCFIPSLLLAGTVAKVPSAGGGGTGEVTIVRTFQAWHMEQEDYDGTDWVCLPAHNWMPQATGFVGYKFETTVTNTFDCTAADALRTQDADTTGGIAMYEAFKPPGVKWTATQLSCMLVSPAVIQSTAADGVDIKLAWRDADTATMDDGNEMEIASTATLNTATTEARSFEIGIEADPASLVVMVNADDTTATNWDSFNLVCNVTIKQE